MNCQYRILKDVHIGLRVRKTKDKTTVPFKNDPMTGVKIEDWSDQGFLLSHSDLPKNIWVDFYQLPLDKIQLEYGIIKNPITFVEEIMQGGSMVLVRADTLDYMEMLHDKKDKDEAVTYSPRQLTPGDRVISAICKQGNVMVYLGTFNIATINSVYSYGYAYTYRDRAKPCHYIDETPERAFFAYEDVDGKHTIKSYPIQNKVVKENYLASDKGRGNRVDPAFTDENKNMEMLLELSHISGYYLKYRIDRLEETKNKYSNFKMSSYDSVCYIQKGKKNIRENSIEYFKQNQYQFQEDINIISLNEKEARELFRFRSR